MLSSARVQNWNSSSLGKSAAFSYTPASSVLPLSPNPLDSKLSRHLRLRGGGKGELVFNRSRVSVWEEEKVLEMDGDDGCTTM